MKNVYTRQEVSPPIKPTYDQIEKKLKDSGFYVEREILVDGEGRKTIGLRFNRSWPLLDKTVERLKKEFPDAKIWGSRQKELIFLEL